MISLFCMAKWSIELILYKSSFFAISLSLVWQLEMQLRRSMTDWRRPWSAIKCVLYPLSPCLVSVRLSGWLAGGDWWWSIMHSDGLSSRIDCEFAFCKKTISRLNEWRTSTTPKTRSLYVEWTGKAARRWWCDLMDRRLTMTDIVCAFSSAPPRVFLSLAHSIRYDNHQRLRSRISHFSQQFPFT